jgi:carbonic anhydrase
LTFADELVRANQRYAAAFTHSRLPMPPGQRVAIVVCMDARIDPARAFGLEEGTAHVIRNAGGRAADALRSLVISQHLLGTREIVVVHHTDCGMLTFTDEQLRRRLHDDLGVDTDMAFQAFTDLEASVREDVETLQRSPLLLPDIPISGFIYDVHTGRVSRVV